MSFSSRVVTKFFALAAAAVLLATPAARADDFTFYFSAGSMIGSGVFTYNPAAVPGVPGAVQVTGMTGTFSDNSIGLTGGTITGIVATGLPTVDADGTFLPPGSPAAGYGFSWDNLFYPGGNSPAVCPPPLPGDPHDPYPFGGGYLDIYGLLFTVSANGNTYVVDIWSNGVLPGASTSTYGVGVALNGTVLDSYGEPFSGTSAIVSGAAVPPPATSPVPEPGSLTLLGTGAMGIAETVRRKLAAR